MLVIPAIDIRDGKCVRLVQGRVDDETVYSNDPVEIARGWEEQGAPMLHLVDLDGAFAGKPKNIEVVKSIRENVSLPLQLGGGIRDLETMQELLEFGINRVVLGTAAVSDPGLVKEACGRFGEKVVIGVDEKNGNVATEGWKTTVEKTVEDFLRNMRDIGVKRVVYTDTSRDGTMVGPNVERIWEVLERAGLKVIVSGGVSCLADVERIGGLRHPNLEGIIVGKALYNEAVDYAEALRKVGSFHVGKAHHTLS